MHVSCLKISKKSTPEGGWGTRFMHHPPKERKNHKSQVKIMFMFFGEKVIKNTFFAQNKKKWGYFFAKKKVGVFFQQKKWFFFYN